MIDLPYKVIRQQIAESLDLVIQLWREPGKRVVSQVLRIKGYVPAEDYFEFEPLYEKHSHTKAGPSDSNP